MHICMCANTEPHYRYQISKNIVTHAPVFVSFSVGYQLIAEERDIIVYLSLLGGVVGENEHEKLMVIYITIYITIYCIFSIDIKIQIYPTICI